MTNDYVNPILLDLVKQVTYKPNWVIYVEHEVGEDGTGGWHLFIVAQTANSLDTSKIRRTRHGFLIPAASYNRATWEVWIFNRLCDVEKHEVGEFYRINDARVFAPHHGNGEDPYLVWRTGSLQASLKSPGDD